jgi:hypothetical protein
MTMTDELVTEARKGGPCAELGNRCRVIEAASGCFCAAVADRIEVLTAQLQVSNELGRALEEDAGQLREDNARLKSGLRHIVTYVAEPSDLDGDTINALRCDLRFVGRVALAALNTGKGESHD